MCLSSSLLWELQNCVSYNEGLVSIILVGKSKSFQMSRVYGSSPKDRCTLPICKWGRQFQLQQANDFKFSSVRMVQTTVFLVNFVFVIFFIVYRIIFYIYQLVVLYTEFEHCSSGHNSDIK